MDIAILGTGNIGGALGRHWGGTGHRVFFGSRDPGRPDLQGLLAACGPNASAGGCADQAVVREGYGRRVGFKVLRA